MIVGHMKVKFGLKSTLNRRNDRKCRFLIKLALLNGSFIEVISCRRLKGSKHGLENDKLYYQKHRHTFYSSRISLEETFGMLGHIVGVPRMRRMLNSRRGIVST